MPAKSSPGADYITVASLKQTPVSALTVLLNLWLFYLDVPAKFKECRTILIPKRYPVSSPNDYRPITISSVVYRLFTKILSSRLNEWTVLNKRQKAFTAKVDRCGENTFMLKSALASARREHRELCIASLDIAKAFDSVSHNSIFRALVRHDVSASGICLIMNLLSDSFTRIEHADGTSEAMQMRRGVKLGDPMSPLLFSLVMDELFDKLDELSAGFTICPGTTLCSLASADDILLLSDCKAGLQSQLLTSYKFFQARNLAVNVDKCSSLRLYRVPKRRTVNVDVKPKFYLNPLEPTTLLPCFTASGFLKYLGVDFNPFGRRKCQIEKADILIQRVCKAELKPQQKLEMIRTYLVPRFLYSLTVGNPLAHTAKTIDKMIRQAVKQILHLPLTTLCDDIFYIPMARGGLGFTNLSEVSDLSILKLIRKMEASDDPYSKPLYQSKDEKQTDAATGHPFSFELRDRCSQNTNGTNAQRPILGRVPRVWFPRVSGTLQQ
uniref:Reverse transcriptase domain-containing protein n=1 Tax=Trichuris muris TaxID=70415 RepID=A0A5S6QF58_TRIMR